MTQLAKVGACFHRLCGSSCSYCAYHASISSTTIEPLATCSEQASPAKSEIIQNPSHDTCVPCVGLFAQQHCQITYVQQDASLPPPGSNVPINTASSMPDWLCIHGSIVITAD